MLQLRYKVVCFVEEVVPPPILSMQRKSARGTCQWYAKDRSRWKEQR